MRFVILYILIIIPASIWAQAIDKTFSYENVAADKYLRFNYENDFFAASDRYYTQGLNFELVLPAFKHVPISKVLLKLPSQPVKYGIGIEHDAYTPTSIQSSPILYGNRPFAAALFLNFFSISSSDKQQLSSTLSLGVVGAAAGGEQIQTTIHALTNNIDPQGWQYQIHNDFALNYRLTYEHKLAAIGNYFLLNAAGTAKLGTLNTKAGISATVMAGIFEHPFTVATGKKFHIYIYERPLVNVVGYDATLQGGLLNKTSPYVIDAADVNRVVFENRAGFIINYNKISLEYFRSYVTREFRTGDVHAWGGVGISAPL